MKYPRKLRLKTNVIKRQTLEELEIAQKISHPVKTIRFSKIEDPL